MKRKRAVLFSVITGLAIILAGCSDSSDNNVNEKVWQATLSDALTRFRVHENGVYDHYFEFKKRLVDGGLLTSMAKYESQPDLGRRQIWTATLSQVQRESLHITGALAHPDKVYWSGYYTLTMDGNLSDLYVNSRSNGFLIEQSRETGEILASTAIQCENGVYESTVIPSSIRLVDDRIMVTGESTGGSSSQNTRLQPESALDEFTIVIDPDTGEVESATLTPLVSTPPLWLPGSLMRPSPPPVP